MITRRRQSFFLASVLRTLAPVTVLGALPPGFDLLQLEARAEGYAHLDRLASEWEKGQPEQRPGEVVMAALAEGKLLAIGGLTVEPSAALPGAYRLRRFYVHPAVRSRGLGRSLAGGLLEHGRAYTSVFTVHAQRPAARAFWEALGFVMDERSGFSHVLRDRQERGA